MIKVAERAQKAGRLVFAKFVGETCCLFAKRLVAARVMRFVLRNGFVPLYPLLPLPDCSARCVFRCLGTTRRTLITNKPTPTNANKTKQQNATQNKHTTKRTTNYPCLGSAESFRWVLVFCDGWLRSCG